MGAVFSFLSLTIYRQLVCEHTENATTQKEQKRYGWKRDLFDMRDLGWPHKQTKLNAEILSKHGVDLRNIYIIPPYNQGHLGSCTANAIAFAYQFVEQNQCDIFLPSRLFIYYHMRAINGTINSDAGASLRDGMKVINRFGVVPEKMWPYNVDNFAVEPTRMCAQIAPLQHSIRYFKLKQTLHDLRNCLKQGFPFVFGFSVYHSFEGDIVSKTGIMQVPEKGEKLLGGHVAAAVGYNDYDKTFIVRNSWGSEWGDGGYFHMPYVFMTDNRFCSDFWVLTTIQDTCINSSETDEVQDNTDMETVAVQHEPEPQKRVQDDPQASVQHEPESQKSVQDEPVDVQHEPEPVAVQHDLEPNVKMIPSQ